MSRAGLTAFAALGAAALAAAGVAAAGHRTQTTRSAAATFSATSIAHDKTTTCVADDGTYENTTATYTGTAGSGDPRLGGSLEIRAHSVLNTSTGLGWMDGSFRVRGNDAGAHGTFHAAIAGGNAVGAIAGTVNRPAGKLVASLAAGFTPSGGFTNGTLGANGSSSGAGTIFSRGSCTRAKHQIFTAVSRLTLTPRAAVPPKTDLKAAASGSLTLDVTRNSSGEIAEAKAVFYVNYRFQGQVTIDDLALYQGARGTNGPKVLDSGAGSFADTDGHGNITQTASISSSLAQAILASPHGYYVQLDTSAGSLRHQLAGFRRR